MNTAHWHWPQWAMMALVAFCAAFTLAKHGELRPQRKYNFWSDLLGSAIQIAILWAGGFFR